MKCKYKYINEAAKETLDGLVTGEHGEVVRAWSTECVSAGFRRGLACGAAATILGTRATYIVREMRDGVVEKYIQSNVKRVVRKLNIPKN